MQINKHSFILAGVFFIMARMILFISLPYEIIPGMGDYWNFYHQASLGWPFIEYWTEFPPVFPFIAKLLFELVNGREMAFGYSLAFLVSLFQAGTVVLVFKIEDKLNQGLSIPIRGLVYSAVTVGLFYSWSYFDAIAVFFMLLGIFYLIEGKDIPASLSITLGILTKWFPGVLLPAIYKIRSKKDFARISLIILGAVVLIWGILFAQNSDLTIASITSQANKGSWETIWALIDGNLGTGNFQPGINHLIPATAKFNTGNDSVIPSWATLILFGILGLFMFFRSKPHGDGWLIHFTGLTMVLFFLWSPGYSPQWVLFLLPLILLGLPRREGVLVVVVLVLLNLLEWPILLSRGYFWSLNYLIPARTAVMILLVFRFYKASMDPEFITGGNSEY